MLAPKTEKIKLSDYVKFDTWSGQRDIDEEHISNIIAGQKSYYNDYGVYDFGHLPIVGKGYNDINYVIDGQHRKKAIQRMLADEESFPSLKDSDIEIRVYTVTEPFNETKYFQSLYERYNSYKPHLDFEKEFTDNTNKFINFKKHIMRHFKDTKSDAMKPRRPHFNHDEFFNYINEIFKNENLEDNTLEETFDHINNKIFAMIKEIEDNPRKHWFSHTDYQSYRIFDKLKKDQPIKVSNDFKNQSNIIKYTSVYDSTKICLVGFLRDPKIFVDMMKEDMNNVMSLIFFNQA